MAFGPFSGDKGNYIDVWRIKITIKTYQIDMDDCFFPNVDIKQKPCLSLNSGFFSISLTVCEFNRHRQTWYQKFTGTYLSLTDPPARLKLTKAA